MSVHNQLPSMVNMLELFSIYDEAACGFKSAVENGDLDKAAEFLQVMQKLDVFLADHRFEG